MVRDESLYLPPSALEPNAPGAMPLEQFVSYLQIVAEMLTSKWKHYDLSGIPDESNRLTRWFQSTSELANYVGNHI